MRRVVVTGASGLLGGYVARAVAVEDDVMGLDARAPAVSGDIAHVTVSILDEEALVTAFAGADAVLHVAAAANIGSGTGGQIIDLNVRGTWTVMEAARRAGVRRVVLCSSDSVMGNTVWKEHFWCPEALPVDETHPVRPADPYALSKYLAEEAGRSFARRGLEVIALRPVFILFPSMMGEARARHADPEGYVGPCAGGHAPAAEGCAGITSTRATWPRRFACRSISTGRGSRYSISRPHRHCTRCPRLTGSRKPSVGFLTGSTRRATPPTPLRRCSTRRPPHAVLGGRPVATCAPR